MILNYILAWMPPPRKSPRLCPCTRWQRWKQINAGKFICILSTPLLGIPLADSVIYADQITLPAEPTTEISAILCTCSGKLIALAGLDHCGVAIFQTLEGKPFFPIVKNWIILHFRCTAF